MTLRTPLRQSIRRHLFIGVAIVAVFCGGIGGWAATAELSGAVIAPGLLVVQTSVKKVQHPTGGVIGELRVREGDRVHEGDVVARLDETQTRANLQVVLKQLDELRARQARDESELRGLATVEFPADLRARAADSDVDRVLKGEQRLLEMRTAARGGLKKQLQEQVLQLREQIRGASEQASGKDREIELIHQELAGVRELWEKKLIQLNRLTALERDSARLTGERGSLFAGLAQLKGKIAETELRIVQIDQDLHTELGKELADLRAKISELVERRVAAEDQLRRVDVKAPQTGRVFQLSVHTVGGVVQPGEPLMLIVPDADRLLVEAKINPQDIDQVHAGQGVHLRFPAFNQRTTPELYGVVEVVSADVALDQRSGTSYYTVRIGVSDQEIAKLDGLRLVPGMPVEAFLETTPRTMISYFAKPFSDQLRKAFREK